MTIAARPPQRALWTEHDAWGMRRAAPVCERQSALIEGELASVERESPAPAEPVGARPMTTWVKV
jgi:hypothetical protein